ncbi:MAG: hybrid sensor histidine kinase/response regulator [Candidatus Nitrospinota bacterium M3_3B_026]
MPSSNIRAIIADFIAETDEILDRVSRELVELESAPDDVELLNHIFRAVHTVKGSASFLGFSGMVTVIHSMENILNLIRRKDLQFTPETNDDLFGLLDRARAELDGIRANPFSATEAGSGKEEKEAPPPAPAEGKRAGRGAKGMAPPTVRVRVSRLNTLMDLVGELVLSRNRLLRLVGQSASKDNGNDPEALRLAETAEKINRTTSQLQAAVMSVRTQPIGSIFGAFARMTRDLVGAQGKEARLEISGENTEVDRSVIEGLQESLAHLLRNAIDHGIEPPEERERKGKPREGLIRISASYEGDSAVVAVADDGRGIDRDAILQAAVDVGLVPIEKAARLDADEITRLIFSPGFTTRAEADTGSGRGVGLDAVMSAVTKMNGVISVDSAHGEGLEIRIKTPLTLAITQALIVKVGGEIFALPASSVEETARVSHRAVQTVNGREAVTLRGRTMPLARLSSLFGIPTVPGKWLYVAVARVADKRFGLVVDSLLGQEEVVVKPITGRMSIDGSAGGTILGDGDVALILDVGRIAQMTPDSRQAPSSASGGRPGAGLRVLIADSSGAFLRREKENFEQAGYEVAVALSGGEVVSLLKGNGEAFDAVIVDSALPEEGGLGLAERLKADPELGSAPVLILTSAGEEVDRDYGYHIGVEDFLPRREERNLPAVALRYIVR